MKSIMEQASSIMKAIEKAWNSAENPKEFTVKIFEKEEKNFFGMATKPAKVGIFFSEKHTTHDKYHSNHDRQQQKCRPEHKESAQKTTLTSRQKAAPVRQQKQTTQSKEQLTALQVPHHESTKKPLAAEKQKTPPHTKPTTHQTGQPTQKISAAWSDAMVGITQEWINRTLSLMNVSNPGFTTEIANRNLKIMFIKPLVENPVVEKQLFRSFAHLIIASLRNQYKQEIKDLKVVLIRPQE